MTEIGPGVRMIDTRLGGRRGLTSAYLIDGTQPALIDPGPETSAALLISELHDLGVGPDDLAWIVLTHIHLDHCGGTGALAAAFPGRRWSSMNGVPATSQSPRASWRPHTRSMGVPHPCTAA